MTRLVTAEKGPSDAIESGRDLSAVFRQHQPFFFCSRQDDAAALIVVEFPSLQQSKTPQLSPGRFQRQNCSFLEQIPEKLVVDFVMKLYFLRLHKRS